MLLVDVFEKFVETCLSYYGLDPCHYFSSPGLSWDAMLKMTRIKLELISDLGMPLFIQKEMRGGISYISKRHSKVEGDNNFIMYWAINQPLPYCHFNFLTKKEIRELCLNSISENSPIGYILEVDLEHCKRLHDSHSDYPLAPEKLKISSDKLVPNMRDKTKYVLHYKNLQCYLSLGMNLIKVHRILKFKKSNWLKEYIEFNTEKIKCSK